MKLSPAATNASSTAKDALSSAVQPKTLPPRHSGATCKAERPRGRSCMLTSVFNRPRGYDDCFPGLDDDLAHIGGRVGSVQVARRRSRAHEARDIRGQPQRRFPGQIVADIVGVVLIARAWRRPHTVLLPIEIHPL